MTSSLRPGVFSTYSVSSAYSPRGGGKLIGMIGDFGTNTAAVAEYTAVPYTVPSGNAALAAAAKAVFAAGAASFKCISVAASATSSDYEAAAALLTQAGAYCIVCQSAEVAILSAMASFAEDEAEEQRECIVLACESVPADAALTAAAVDSERLILVSSSAACAGDSACAIVSAAACAALIAQSEDPSLPFSGAELAGVVSCTALSPSQIEALLAAGVTPLETVGDAVCCVRLLTTRTTTAGVADRTFAPANTILIIDYVLSSLRGSLRLLLRGARNNAATISAIGSQVTVLLQGMLDAGIITAFSAPSVYPESTAPENCIVAVSFSAACVINQIHIQAHIQL